LKSFIHVDEYAKDGRCNHQLNIINNINSISDINDINDIDIINISYIKRYWQKNISNPKPVLLLSVVKPKDIVSLLCVPLSFAMAYEKAGLDRLINCSISAGLPCSSMLQRPIARSYSAAFGQFSGGGRSGQSVGNPSHYEGCSHIGCISLPGISLFSAFILPLGTGQI
jgi:hypothetical protein